MFNFYKRQLSEAKVIAMHCVFLVYVKIKYLTKIAQTIGEENGSNLLGGPYSTHE